VLGIKKIIKLIFLIYFFDFNIFIYKILKKSFEVFLRKKNTFKKNHAITKDLVNFIFLI
jgi:hypothetical protein